MFGWLVTVQFIAVRRVVAQECYHSVFGKYPMPRAKLPYFTLHSFSFLTLSIGIAPCNTGNVQIMYTLRCSNVPPGSIHLLPCHDDI
uniref:Putative secreted protein n=1 Tax=Rhipicephalus microplus TaxID=6941 RepID=A0A6M2DAE6_RHIMP